MIGTGNHIIDGDMGDNYHSPLYDDSDGVSVILKVFFWDMDNQEWSLNTEREFESMEVTVDSLLQIINEDAAIGITVQDLFFDKKNCDEIIARQILSEEEVVKYELYYN